jgi:glycosyltransferase involved in cell wall biosynthesis
MKKILFLVPHPPGISPSQRFRFEQYFIHLITNGFRYDIQSFLDLDDHNVFNRSGGPLRKIYALMKGFFRRLTILAKTRDYDFVFIHRECAPVGPPVFEWILAKILRRKIIYDFDDAVWMTDKTDESALVRIVKWRSKVGKICRWAYKVSCGNEYLSSYARRFNSNVVYNPTTLETTDRHNPQRYARPQSEVLTIGWTGSHSTLKYLNALESVFQTLQQQYKNIRLVIIADHVPALNVPFVFRRWTALSEVQDLMEFDIGVMPLPDDEWSKGKCGFKALQYLSLEIPAVASPVGVNTTIIRNDETGYLCVTNEDWITALESLIRNKELRRKMGQRGRDFVEKNYSVNSNYANFLGLFK